jgi:hypothetical protein
MALHQQSQTSNGDVMVESIKSLSFDTSWEELGLHHQRTLNNMHLEKF